MEAQRRGEDRRTRWWRTRWWRRLRAFLKSNGAIVLVGVASHGLAERAMRKAHAGRPLRATDWARLIAGSTSKIAVFLAVITASATSKPPLLGSKRTKVPSSQDTVPMVLRALGTGAAEAAGMAVAARWLDMRRRSRPHRPRAIVLLWALWYARFVVKSFAFEVVFDLFHYWTHRTCHVLPSLYKYHKSHHKFLHPSPLSTYQQHPLDIVLTNIAPNIATLALLKRVAGIRWTGLEYSVLLSYKVFVEIAGHAGVATTATSFPQCAPLPELLGIQMQTSDHDAHHAFPSSPANFSKRFTLWDKVFGTYRGHLLLEQANSE